MHCRRKSFIIFICEICLLLHCVLPQKNFYFLWSNKSTKDCKFFVLQVSPQSFLSLSIGICTGFMNENSACTCTLFYGAEIVSNTSRQQYRIISTKWPFQTDSILRGRNNALFQHLQHGILRLMCTRNRDAITTIRWLFSQFPQVIHTNF